MTGARADLDRVRAARVCEARCIVRFLLLVLKLRSLHQFNLADGCLFERPCTQPRADARGASYTDCRLPRLLPRPEDIKHQSLNHIIQYQQLRRQRMGKGEWGRVGCNGGLYNMRCEGVK